MKAEITYLYHSAFAVKTPSHFLVFDLYYYDSDSRTAAILHRESSTRRKSRTKTLWFSHRTAIPTITARAF
jgi:L-ascorbate metabolism protein UlaG (beta-lactamase superfamily)